MARLDRLQISGIRSFGPDEDDTQTVKFFSPLTLFLGQNGCGKTTIIESLKFACTGDLPDGTSSGQGFVNDPKINSSTQTKGQVRLKLTDSKSNEVTIIKSIQVTMLTGNKLKFNALDYTVRLKKPSGEESTISSRCADINNFCCQTMGVSKSILNNVIFCQQDNSLWPLDDGKKLKEKFDEIFNISIYNKGVDSLRANMKHKKEEAKTLNQTVIYKKEKKEDVERKRAKLGERKNELQSQKSQISDKKKELLPLEQKLKEICQIESQLVNLEKQIASKESDQRSKQSQQTGILKNIAEEFNGTDDELQTEINSFKLNRDKDNANVQEFQNHFESIEKSQKVLMNIMTKEQVRIGQLQEEKKQHQIKINERSELIAETCMKLKIPNTTNADSNFDADKVISELQAALSASKTKLQELQRTNDSEEKALQNSIDQCRDKNVKTNHEINLKNKQISETQKKSREIQGQLRDLNVSDEQLKNFASKIMKIDKDLEILKTSFDSAAVTAKISSEKQRIITMEREQEELERERKVLQKNSITENDLENKNIYLIKRESDLNRLRDKHFDSLSYLFDTLPDTDLTQHIENRVKEANKTFKKLTTQMNQTQEIITRQETECKMKNKDLKIQEDKLKTNKNKIFKVCKGKPFESVVNELHLEIETQQKDKGVYSSGNIIYEKYIEKLNTEKNCPICSTGFQSKPASVTSIVNKLKDEIKSFPGELKKVEAKLLKLQDEQSRLLPMRSLNDEIEELQERIKMSQVEIKNLEENVQSNQRTLVEVKENIKTPEKEIKICNATLGDAALIDQYQREIKNSKLNISALESQLIKVVSNLSMHQVDEKLDNIKEDLSNLRKSCETLQKKIIQNNERRHSLGDDRNKLVESQLNLQKAMQGRPQLEDQKIELMKKEEQLKAEVESLEGELINFTAELAIAEQTLKSTKETNKANSSALNFEYNSNDKLVSDVVKLQQTIQSFYDREVSKQFDSAIDKLTKLKEKEETYIQSKKTVVQSINELKMKIENHKSAFRTLDDNLALRTLRKEEAAIKSALAILKEKKKNHNPVSLQQEKSKLNKQYITLEKEIATLAGKSNELIKFIDELQTELDSPENVAAYKEYKKKYFEWQIVEHLIVDLKLYLQAFESSIIQFHAERMMQINISIKHLWRAIYRGNDIDYIKISTEEPTGTQNKRSYNYKVIQCKNDVEIDMRGRCSAGQKVLACLVIRMALAETFSHNCGILALDEPTTNLDRENIISLSETLARIANTRQAEKNFQLLIITHDDYFLNTLKQVNNVNYYYKVSRNKNGNSIVTREIL